MAKSLARKGRILTNMAGGLVEVEHTAVRKGVSTTVKTVCYQENAAGDKALIKHVTKNPTPFREDLNRTRLTDGKNGTVSSADPFKAAAKELQAGLNTGKVDPKTAYDALILAGLAPETAQDLTGFVPPPAEDTQAAAA